jgi:outer membrane immunogenic protein
MRWLICALVVLASAPHAFADDFDVLRGPQPVAPAMFPRWSGFYVGGQFGYSDVNADFSNATQAPIAYALRETTLEAEFSPSAWPVLGIANHSGIAYGGFAGYNTQWQDVIVGVEANYNHTSLSLLASNTPLTRITPGSSYLVNITGSGSLANLDFASLRARAGWVLGNFLPYGFVGFALGRADIATSATVSGEQNPPTSGTCASNPTCVPFSFTSSATQNSALLYGFAIGGGVDVALTANIFLRGEFEFDQFAPISGISIGIATAHVGAGVKF